MVLESGFDHVGDFTIETQLAVESSTTSDVGATTYRASQNYPLSKEGKRGPRVLSGRGHR